MKNIILIPACWSLLAFWGLAAYTSPAMIKTPAAPNVKLTPAAAPTPAPQREEEQMIRYEGEDGRTALE